MVDEREDTALKLWTLMKLDTRTLWILGLIKNCENYFLDQLFLV